MPGTLTNLSEQMSKCFADVLFYLHNVELLLNDEFKPNVDDLFCRSANRSARTTRRGSEFCSCVDDFNWTISISINKTHWLKILEADTTLH